MTIGFRILPRTRAVDGEIIRRFTALPVANVSDSMGRMSAGGARLTPYHAPGKRFGGPALTVRTRPGDNLIIHKALDMAVAGDMIVIDAGGDLTSAVIGDIMTSLALAKGVTGFVIDGAIRDADDIRGSGIGMFAAGVTHRGPYKDGPGEINVPVSIGGMIVEPGDVVLGDGDGVLAVPFDAAETILAAAEAKQAAETKELEAIAAGRQDRSWVDKALRERGYDVPS